MKALLQKKDSINYLFCADPLIINLNIGTGIGTSVLELVETFKEVNNVSVPYVLKDKRQGDIGSCYCNPSSIKTILKWKPKFSGKKNKNFFKFLELY